MAGARIEKMNAGEEAVKVIVLQADAAIEHEHRFKKAVAITKTPVICCNDGLFGRKKPAVVVDKDGGNVTAVG